MQGSRTNTYVYQRVPILGYIRNNSNHTQTNKFQTDIAAATPSNAENTTGFTKTKEAQSQDFQNTSNSTTRYSANAHKPTHRRRKQTQRTESHNFISDTSQTLLADNIGRTFTLSETSKIHDQSLNSPHLFQHQAFANMSSAPSSSSRRKRSQERYVSFCSLNFISHQEQILWVKIPPVTLGHLNGLDLILLIN